MTVSTKAVPRESHGISRREFIGGLGVGLVATALGLSGLESLASRTASIARLVTTGSVTPERSPARMMRSSFLEHVGERFRIHLGFLKWARVRLTEVTDLTAKYSPARDGRTLDTEGEVFSVVFSSPQSELFEQDTYMIEHGELGRFDLFIVPIDPDGGAARYEAIFNRAVPAQ